LILKTLTQVATVDAVIHSMFKRPKVAITSDYLEKSEYSAFPHFILRENYLEAVYKSGGEPFLLNYFLNPDDIFKEFDAILIPGGNFDISPEFYGEAVKSDTVSLNSKRTDFESKLLKNVMNSKMPVLGICGGEQLINVLYSGTLIQHIPDEIENCLEHEQKTPKNEPSHEVKVVEGTKLHQITGKTSFMVNSTHHQAVKNVGQNIIASSYAPDGVIESIEHTSHPFMIGVEWHPEYLTTDEDKKIFDHFIQEAEKYGKTRKNS